MYTRHAIRFERVHFSHIGVRKCLIAHDSVILCENGTEYGANMRIHVRYLFLTSIVILEKRVHIPLYDM